MDGQTEGKEKVTMGMPKGSRWKRLAVFSDTLNNMDQADRVSHILRSSRIEMEWWRRSVPHAKGGIPAMNPMNNLGRDASPVSEEWLMVHRGNWPLAFVLVKDVARLG